jgi:hypothetical protein
MKVIQPKTFFSKKKEKTARVIPRHFLNERHQPGTATVAD